MTEEKTEFQFQWQITIEYPKEKQKNFSCSNKHQIVNMMIIFKYKHNQNERKFELLLITWNTNLWSNSKNWIECSWFQQMVRGWVGVSGEHIKMIVYWQLNIDFRSSPELEYIRIFNRIFIFPPLPLMKMKISFETDSISVHWYVQSLKCEKNGTHPYAC